MQRFTNSGRDAIAQNNFYAALSIALMLPDICASMEDPGPGKTQKRYEKWCDKWVIPKFTNSGTVWLSAQDCFQLRCSLIHSGSTQIEQTKRKGLDEIVFFDNEIKTHFNKVTGQTINGVKQPNVLQLNAAKFSETMYLAAEAWDAAVASDAAVQSEKAKLLVIHTKGAVISGVLFG